MEIIGCCGRRGLSIGCFEGNGYRGWMYRMGLQLDCNEIESGVGA